ncbi:MAG: hypothetical protein R6V85_13005 [Polyangia bacterium]
MRVLPVCVACLAAAGCAGGGGGADTDAGADTGPELAVDVSCGGYSCAITERGAVECWGGCFGCPDGECNQGFPCQVRGVKPGAVYLEVGGRHACAAMEDGSVRCWGTGTGGELGGNCSGGICDVPGLEAPASQVGVGIYTSCALVEGGRVRCWGCVDLECWLPPQTIGGWESGVVELREEGWSALAVTDFGAVEIWDKTTCPGMEPSEDCPAPPAAVEGLPGPAIEADLARAACALLESGELMCWGENDNGQLGDGTTEDREEPVSVLGLEGVEIVEVVLGSEHTCALSGDGRVFCWGYNQRGQVGTGEISDELSAWKVTEPSEVVGLSEPIVSVSAGTAHTCAAGASGAVYCWGDNSAGEIGNGRDKLACESDDDSCQLVELTDNSACYCPSPVRVVGLGPEPDGGWPEPIEDGY